ncbi:MAG: alpha/beta fold hydrolase [Gemmataceae bacterium]|nr:alpha/beta fold hydrolase [Gemmataceae bacterium]
MTGGFAFGKADWEMTEPYRKAGFVVMTPFLRGENGQPGSFTLLDDEVDDVVAAGEFLTKLPYADAGRSFVAGHSSGGTLTMLAASTTTRFRGAAALSGAPDHVAFLQGMEDLAPFDLNDVREFEMRSAVVYAKSLKCPTRLYYGADEEPLFEEGCERTATLAKQHKLDVEAVAVEGDHHSCVPAAIDRSIAFFKSQK